MRSLTRSHKRELGLTAASVFYVAAAGAGWTQEVLDWDASPYFQYNIQEAKAVPNAIGKYDVTVLFSVTDPQNHQAAWDIKRAPEFLQPAGVSRLALALGWSTDDYQNTGALGEQLLPVPYGAGGTGAALPLSKDAIKSSVETSPGLYSITFTNLPFQATRTGIAILEGHPASQQVDPNGVITWERVPVKSAYKFFPITVSQALPRREVVDINKCKVCHDGGVHGNGVVPRLSLHGGNRTEELHVCQVCHNPNQTDIAYRTSGAEVSIDFKRMVHSIHAGGFRKSPFSVVGFRGAVSDFSGVRFPAELSDCTICHIDNGTKGTFELPLGKNVLGSTVDTRSVAGALVDVNPVNDRKISPTAAVCSSCHDKNEVINHMISKGARFAATQTDLSSGKVRERCVDCHGPGREEDLRRVHEIGGRED